MNLPPKTNFLKKKQIQKSSPLVFFYFSGHQKELQEEHLTGKCRQQGGELRLIYVTPVITGKLMSPEGRYYSSHYNNEEANVIRRSLLQRLPLITVAGDISPTRYYSDLL